MYMYMKKIKVLKNNGILCGRNKNNFTFLDILEFSEVSEVSVYHI